MNEIEIKIRLMEPDKFKKQLEDFGCVLPAPITQKDVIFVHESMSEYKIVEGAIVVRTRDEAGRITLTLKQQLSKALSSKEYEVEVSSAETVQRMLPLMGFKELVRVNKTRIKSTHEHFNICIDEVEQLGGFVELECMTEREDIENVQSEMYEFLSNLGVAVIEKVTIPYDTQIYHLMRSKDD